MELPVWLKITFVVIILVAQAGWLLNLLRKIAQAVGLYKSDEQLARIFLEKERLRSQFQVFNENSYREQMKNQWANELKEAQSIRERLYQEEMKRQDDLERQQQAYRDVTPSTKRLTSPLRLLGYKKRL